MFCVPVCLCMWMCLCTSWEHVRSGMKQKQRKGQTGVGTQFSLGHRWCVEQNVRLRLGGHVKEGVAGMSAYTSDECVLGVEGG